MFFNNKPSEGLPMFDQQRIGANIMKARKNKGLTQMALADALGVSFQAVSNWERGQTCPDIANLSELSRLLDISIDELLGNKRAARITKELVEEKAPALQPEELVQVAPLLTEEQADKAAVPQKMSMMELATCAPFVSREFLNKRARQHLEEGCSLWELTSVAPFLDRELLGELALISYDRGDSLSDIACIAPYLGKEITGVLVKNAFDADQRPSENDLSALMPFLDKEFRSQLVRVLLREGRLTDITPLLPFLDKKLIEDYLDSKK